MLGTRGSRAEPFIVVNQSASLFALHEDIDARAQHIREGHPDWLCSKGCDACCRRLADIPRLTQAEWELLKSGLAQLPAAQRAEIAAKVAALAHQPKPPLTCPLLDETSGACPVYRQRPVACRTYGFYVQRELGLYCGEIETRVAAGHLPTVIWGNHDVIDRQLAALGDTRTLTEWFAQSGNSEETVI